MKDVYKRQVFDIFIGVFASLSVTKYNFKGRGLLVSFFTSPMFIPSISFAFVLLRTTAAIKMMTPFSKILVGHLIIILPYIIRNTMSILVNYNWTVEDLSLIHIWLMQDSRLQL